MLSNFYYNKLKSPIKDFSNFIETLLDNIGYEYPKDYIGYKNYYLAFNPLIKDTKSKSCKIHRKDGIMLMYNGNIEVKRKGVITTSNSITPSEYARLLNKFNLYIDFVIKHYGIDLSTLREYKNHLIDTQLNTNPIVNWSVKRGAENFRRFLFDQFITDDDIINYNANKTMKKVLEQFNQEQKEVFELQEIQIKEPLKFNQMLITKYMKERLIPSQKNTKGVVVDFNNDYMLPAICFEYPNGFKKLRFIKKNSKKRYLAYDNDGKYECLFEARVNGTKNCIIVEGEIEALSLLGIVEDDVYAMHNVNSVPKNLNQLVNYSKVFVRVDFDKFKEVKDGIENSINKFIRNNKLSIELDVKPKIICEDKEVDYNYLLKKNMLTKNMIYDIINYKEQ